MPTPQHLMTFLGLLVILAPLSLLVVLGVASLFDRPFSEQTTTRILQVGTAVGLLAALAVLGLVAWLGTLPPLTSGL